VKTLTRKEWTKLYTTVWRKPFAHMPKELRQRLVRGCQGKALYESFSEALKTVKALPPIDGKYAGAYRCPLCIGIHIGNSKDPRPIRPDIPGWLIDALDMQREIKDIPPLMYRYSETPAEREDWLERVAADAM